MTVTCFLSVFLFVLYFFPMSYSGTESPATAGTFKTSVVSVNDCRNPSRPYLKNPPMIFIPKIENVDGRNMLGGNLTILRDTKDVKMKIKSFTMRNGKLRPSHSFNNLDCHGALVHFTFTAFKIKYDKKTCMFFKGFYSFKNMDVNQLQHMWVPTMPYGRLIWRSETFSKGVMFICKEFDTITEPAFYG